PTCTDACEHPASIHLLPALPPAAGRTDRCSTGVLSPAGRLWCMPWGASGDNNGSLVLIIVIRVGPVRAEPFGPHIRHIGARVEPGDDAVYLGPHLLGLQVAPFGLSEEALSTTLLPALLASLTVKLS